MQKKIGDDTMAVMKYISFFLSVWLGIVGAIPVAGEGPEEKFLTLENGFRSMISGKTAVPLVHFVCAAGIGLKNETAETNGLVHLLEHQLLFGSTDRRSAAEKRKIMSAMGAMYNAHTDHDLMTLEITVPADAALKIPSMIEEFIFHPRFLVEEVEKEKQIIQEEIRQLEDNPRTLSTSLVLQQLFLSHPYGQPLYGSPSKVAEATPAQLESLHRRYFAPANCLLGVVGKVDPETLGKEITRCFEGVEKQPLPDDSIPQSVPLSKSVESERTMDIQQANLVVGFFAPHVNHEDRIVFSLLTSMLGQGRSPMIYRAFQGRAGMVEEASVSYISLSYGGAVLFRVITDGSDIRSCKNQLFSFLGEINSANFSREDFLPKDQMYVIDSLGGAKKQMLLNSEENRENGMQLALSYIRYLMIHEHREGLDFASVLRQIDSTRLRGIIRKYLSGKPHSSVTIKPMSTRGKK